MQHNIICILHINNSNNMFCSIHDFTFLMTDTKIKGQVSFESSEKKKLACMIFSKICYVACAINCAGKLIYLHACLHKCDGAGLIDKPDIMILIIFYSFMLVLLSRKYFSLFHDYLNDFKEFKLKLLLEREWNPNFPCEWELFTSSRKIYSIKPCV